MCPVWPQSCQLSLWPSFEIHITCHIQSPWQVNSSDLGVTLCALDGHPSPVGWGNLDWVPVVGCDHDVGVQIELVRFCVLVLELHRVNGDDILDQVVVNKHVLCLVDLHGVYQEQGLLLQVRVNSE